MLYRQEKDPIRALAYKTSRKIRRECLNLGIRVYLPEHYFDKTVLLALRHAARIQKRLNPAYEPGEENPIE